MAETGTSAVSFQFRGSTFDNMVETLGGAFGAFSAQPVGRNADFHWGIDLAACDNAVLITGFHQDEFRFSIEPTSDTTEYLSVVIPRRGGMGVTYGSSVATAGADKLLIYNNFEPDSVVMYGEANLIDELLISWSTILQTVGQTFDTSLSGSLDLKPELDFSTPAGQIIGNLAATMMNGMRDKGPLLRSTIAMTNLTQALADLVVRFVPHRLSHLLEKTPSLISPRHVRRAMDFMQANVHRPITMGMVAEAAGVSVRTLQTGFRAFRDTTPAAYLAKLRLHASRQDLLDPFNNHSVKQVCLKWGFFHFGRFSAIYRATYGESPSETRRRARP